MKKRLFLVLSVIVVLFFVLIGLAILLSPSIDQAIEDSNAVCIDQRFSSPQLAMEGLEKEKRDNYSIELDYCPPYELVYAFEYEKNTIVFYSYCSSYDGSKESSYAVRILKHNEDGTYTFTGGFADLLLEEPSNNVFDMFYYYYTNISTSEGVRSISFLFLEKDNAKDVYVDGKKCEKVLVNMEGREFYLCYALSGKDTFLSNLVTPMILRHKVEVR